jgi:hypothetical protein
MSTASVPSERKAAEAFAELPRRMLAKRPMPASLARDHV